MKLLTANGFSIFYQVEAVTLAAEEERSRRMYEHSMMETATKEERRSSINAVKQMQELERLRRCAEVT